MINGPVVGAGVGYIAGSKEAFGVSSVTADGVGSWFRRSPLRIKRKQITAIMDTPTARKANIFFLFIGDHLFDFGGGIMM